MNDAIEKLNDAYKQDRRGAPARAGRPDRHAGRALRRRHPPDPGGQQVGGGEVLRRDRGAALSMILAVIGTRPEVVKMAPVIRGAAAARASRCKVVGTGQHSDWKMMGTFLETFDLDVDHRLDARASRSARQLRRHPRRSRRAVHATHKPSLVLAQGDTTTVLAAALAARKTRLGVRPRRGRAARVLARAARGGAPDLRRRARRPAVRADPDRGREPRARAGQRQGHPDRQHRPRRAARAPAARSRRPARRHPGHAAPPGDRRRSGEARAGARGARPCSAATHRVEWPVHPRTVAKITEVGLGVPAVRSRSASRSATPSSSRSSRARARDHRLGRRPGRGRDPRHAVRLGAQLHRAAGDDRRRASACSRAPTRPAILAAVDAHPDATGTGSRVPRRTSTATAAPARRSPSACAEWLASHGAARRSPHGDLS